MVEYNNNNIFAKIIRKEIYSEIIFEDNLMLIIKDIKPQAPIHWLVIPKNLCSNLMDFCVINNTSTIGSLWKNIVKIIKMYNIIDFKILINNGESMGQEILHIHLHILANIQNNKLLGQ